MGFELQYEARLAKEGGFLSLNEFRLAQSRRVTTREEFLTAIDGNRMIDRCADGMTYEKKMCSEESLGKKFIFDGSVYNVKSQYEAQIKLSTIKGNYADVIFRENIAGKFRQGEVLKFAGTITDIGTGIIISHTITDAVLLPE